MRKCVILLSYLVLAGSLFAVDIPIVNGDFEATPFGSAEWSSIWPGLPNYDNSTVAEGWSMYEPAWRGYGVPGTTFQMFPQYWEHQFPGVDQTPYGLVARVTTVGGWQQALNVPVQAGEYTIDFDFGSGTDLKKGVSLPWFVMELVAGDVSIFKGGVNMHPDPDVTVGTIVVEHEIVVESGAVPGVYQDWVHQTFTFDNTAGAGLGDDLTLRFYGDAYAMIDNISMSYVPEPATMMLLGLGGLLIRRRRA